MHAVALRGQLGSLAGLAGPHRRALLHTCHFLLFCRTTADKYVEYEAVLLFIDMVLHKVAVYRHLLFNRPAHAMHRAGAPGLPQAWKIFAALVLVDTYTKLYQHTIDKAGSASAADGDVRVDSSKTAATTEVRSADVGSAPVPGELPYCDGDNDNTPTGASSPSAGAQHDVIIDDTCFGPGVLGYQIDLLEQHSSFGRLMDERDKRLQTLRQAALHAVESRKNASSLHGTSDGAAAMALSYLQAASQWASSAITNITNGTAASIAAGYHSIGNDSSDSIKQNAVAASAGQVAGAEGKPRHDNEAEAADELPGLESASSQVTVDAAGNVRSSTSSTGSPLSSTSTAAAQQQKHHQGVCRPRPGAHAASGSQPIPITVSCGICGGSGGPDIMIRSNGGYGVQIGRSITDSGQAWSSLDISGAASGGAGHTGGISGGLAGQRLSSLDSHDVSEVMWSAPDMSTQIPRFMAASVLEWFGYVLGVLLALRILGILGRSRARIDPLTNAPRVPPPRSRRSLAHLELLHGKDAIPGARGGSFGSGGASTGGGIGLARAVSAPDIFTSSSADLPPLPMDAATSTAAGVAASGNAARSSTVHLPPPGPLHQSKPASRSSAFGTLAGTGSDQQHGVGGSSGIELPLPASRETSAKSTGTSTSHESEQSHPLDLSRGTSQASHDNNSVSAPGSSPGSNSSDGAGPRAGSASGDRAAHVPQQQQHPAPFRAAGSSASSGPSYASPGRSIIGPSQRVVSGTKQGNGPLAPLLGPHRDIIDPSPPTLQEMKSTAVAILVSSFARAFIVLTTTWAYPPSFIRAVTVFTLTSNAAALQALCDCPPIDAAALVGCGYLSLLVIRGLLFASGLADGMSFL